MGFRVVEEARTRNITVTDERIWHRGVDGQLRNRYSEMGLQDTASIDMKSTDSGMELAAVPNGGGGGPAAVLSVRRPGGTVGRGEVFGRE